MAYRWGAPAGGSQGWGGPGGGGSAQAPVGLPYTFSTATDDSDISNYRGQVRINNVNPASATTMWIAQDDAEVQDRGTVLNTLSAGGLVYINTAREDGVVGVFRVTAMVDSGTYYTLTVDRFTGALPNDGAEVRVTIAPVEVTRVKRYVARLTQSGTNPPTEVQVVEDSIGDVSYSRYGLGSYGITGTFPAGKTLARTFGWFMNGDGQHGPTVTVSPTIDDDIGLSVWFEGATTDGDFSIANTWGIEIIVIP